MRGGNNRVSRDYYPDTEPIPKQFKLPSTVEEGMKDDSGKARYDLLAPEALSGLVDVLTFGARKYADRNWERGIAFSRVFGAVMRHLWAWWRGEDNDPETGLSHLDHAACCIHFLSTYTKRGMSRFDDRSSRVSGTPPSDGRGER
jgi:hypothetical protein